MRQARAAAEARDGKACAVAVERAIHIGIEASTGLKSRGVLREQLVPALIELGVQEACANDLAQGLRDCEAVRFEPEATQGASEMLVDRAQSALRALSHHRKAGAP